ncbi:LysR substrate-binding domain-containing protein [Pseudomonas segetis]
MSGSGPVISPFLILARSRSLAARACFCLVAAGAGISVVPASMQGFHEGSVVYCRIRDAKPRLTAPVTLLCRSFNQSPPITHFIELAQQLSSQYRKRSMSRSR